MVILVVVAKGVAVGAEGDALLDLGHDRLALDALVHHGGDGSDLIPQVVEVNRRAMREAAVGAGQGVLVLEEPVLVPPRRIAPGLTVFLWIEVGHVEMVQTPGLEPG